MKQKPPAQAGRQGEHLWLPYTQMAITPPPLEAAGTLDVTALGGDAYDALDAYTQFNSAISAPGVHLITAYRADASLWLLGLDVETGGVLLERERNATAGLSPNFDDMAFWAGA